MIDQWLNSLSALIANNSWISPMLALAAGVLTSITPCALSSVPLVIGYVGGTSGNEPKRAFRLSIVFRLVWHLPLQYLEQQHLYWEGY